MPNSRYPLKTPTDSLKHEILPDSVKHITPQNKESKLRPVKVGAREYSRHRIALHNVDPNSKLVEKSKSQVFHPQAKIRREGTPVLSHNLRKRKVFRDADEPEERKDRKQQRLASNNLKVDSDNIALRTRLWTDLDILERRDPSMVAEYSGEIFGFLYKRELETMASHNYLLDSELPNYIRPAVRAILVDWLVEVHDKFQCFPETLYLTINLMDRFLADNKVSTDKLQLLAVTSLFIAAKFEEIHLPKLSEYAYITDGAATTADIKTAELYMLIKLKFDIGWPNPLNFLRRISKADEYHTRTRNIGKFLLEYAMCCHHFITCKSSELAAIAMYVARRIEGRNDILWDETFKHYSGGIDALHDEVFQKNCRTLITEISSPQTKLDALRAKYSREEFGSVYQDIDTWCTRMAQGNFDGLFSPQQHKE